MVRSFDELTTEQQSFAGGKGGTLAQLSQAGYPVPDGFVILPTAFAGDKLVPEAWAQVQTHLRRIRSMRKADNGTVFAVRSSALSEDSAQASFAGEFETVLDVHTDEAIRAAIHTVRRSRQSERVRAYSQAKGVDTAQSGAHQGGVHEMAVVVQRLVRADISGVLFTADPVTGSHTAMVGNFVHGLGEELVSGEAEPYTFTLQRPKGRYSGPPELKRFARKLYKLAIRLEKELGCPQDIEWAIAGSKLYLLQSRPITTLRGHNPATGEWNDSLTGDYLWSNCNFSEALPGVMTPLTWSMTQIFHCGTMPIKMPGNHPPTGNIGGRAYMNLSLLVSLYHAVGMNVQNVLKSWGDVFGRVPEGLDVPLLPSFNLGTFLTMIPGNIKWEIKFNKLKKELPDYIATSPGWCSGIRQQIQKTQTKAALASLWRENLEPCFLHSCWMLRVAMKQFTEPAFKLRRGLIKLVGEADTNALLSNLSGGSEMASLGLMAGLAQVARGEMSRKEYLERYGHRGPHECELSMPRPAQDPNWLDQQLAEFERSPFDVEVLLAKQRVEFNAAWKRFQDSHPRKIKAIQRQLEVVSSAARSREAVRSEWTRVCGTIRAFALRAGELTGLGDDIFFLDIDEILGVLSGNEAATAFISVRRETHARYSALPPYPTIINGRFDPFEWAADPDRRSDVFDSHAPISIPDSDTISGFAGAAGRVEGLVRRLDRAEEGDQLQPGEILVTTTTNVGWTPLFPRAAAIVTDVGAPLSHAAIVARELGVPAVVGCGDATTRLCTGDRVLVDGGQGIVEILKTA